MRMIAPGTSLGRYQIRERLGAGAMGEVYLAFDPELERAVAVKVLPDDLAADAARLVRFVREAKAASALNHPNILTVYDVGTHEAMRFLVTEYVDGRTLRRWLAEERPALVDVLDIVAQAATALQAAHAAGIVHRDVKPENIMLRCDGLVKVLDFGIAKLTAAGLGEPEPGASPAEMSQTLPGTLLGTVRYMSPEQARGAEVDARTDVWSLGVVLYELVAGQPPFAARSRMATLSAILDREPEPLELAAPGTPGPLGRLVGRALRKERDERLGSAAELAAELRQLEAAIERVAATIGDPLGAEAAIETILTERSDGARPTNLPASTSPLTGRERELEELAALLRAPETRLLTITGAGGAGKTRLAVEAARAALPDFADGAFAVELSALRVPEHVAPQIAEALGVNEAPGARLAESLERFLADKRMLLVLDNFEHLLEAAPLVGGLLRAAPKLTALVTSRSRLHLSEERELALEPLEVPVYSSLPPLDEVGRCAAVALFVERARTVRPSFELTAENAHAVCEICRRLDGLPLALELAAARVRFLTPEALLGRLDRRLKLLTGGTLDLPDRQQTMRAAIAWSYDLLEAHERALVRRLAVFASGCTLEAAEAVCEAADVEVLDAVTSLVDKSLLRHREQFDGQVRFTMLEVVREFGLEQLDAEGEADAVRLAHARHFINAAEASEQAIRGAAPGTAIKLLALEYENVRLALGFLLERLPEECTRLVSALLVFWHTRNLYSEGCEWIGRVLAASEVEPSVRVKLLHGAGDLARSFGDLEEAARYAHECAEVSRAIGDRKFLALALTSLGTICLSRPGEASQARRYFEDALVYFRELGLRRLEGVILANLACTASLEGHYAEGRAFCEQALEIEGRASGTDVAAMMLLTLGELCYRMGDLAAARASYLESLSIATEIGNHLYVVMGLDGLAAVALETGESRRAARLGGAAEALLEGIGGALDASLEQKLHEDYVARLRETLDADELEREWAGGRALSMDAAVEEATS
jgi:predicted ATPase